MPARAGRAVLRVTAIASLFVIPAVSAIPAQAKDRAQQRSASFAFPAPVRIVQVDLDAAEGVFVSDEDRAVVLKEIRERLTGGLPAASDTAPAYKMLVVLTRFSRGSAAARMTLIGLGSVHVEGKVRLTAADGTVLPDAIITKGLVLGGLAGGLVSSNGVIARFANAVVASVRPATGLR